MAKPRRADYVEYGSPEHRFLTGVDKYDEMNKDEAKIKAALEKALEAKPPLKPSEVLKANSGLERKRPAVLHDPDEHIMDGWRKRRGRT